MIPCERIAELFADLFGSPMSAGTVSNILMKGGQRSGPSVARIEQELRSAPVVHADETGASLGGVGHWLHVACTSLLSRFYFHPKRGMEGLEDMGILPGYKGKVIHDFFQSYYHYDSYSHGLCNARHLRDLTYIHEV
ncbi:MAG: transposase, partial [Verrucomicrobia bacterium]|nr:transposase [Verrucomicrobiota bacterium]